MSVVANFVSSIWGNANHQSMEVEFFKLEECCSRRNFLLLKVPSCLEGLVFPAGFGGIFREERGHWVLGFYGRLEDCTSLEAELWGIFRGLELVRSQNMETLEVESDFATAIELIKGEAPAHSPHKTLIEECKAILAITRCTLNHTYREGTQSRTS